MTRVALGIDAAWTLTHPSGVALITDDGTGWRCHAVAPSYSHFVELAGSIQPTGTQAIGSPPDAEALIAAATHIADAVPSIVAIDMPLSIERITCRRNADNAISRAYGARKCSTHTPSAMRPGKISDDLRHGFESAGYPLATISASGPCLIEVYPHPALVELMAAVERLPYKVSKARKYWPSMAPADRRLRLIDQWGEIINALERVVAGVADMLPLPSPSALGHQLKAFEDMLDAVVCAWVGAEVLDGRAKAHGDGKAAIWVPNEATPINLLQIQP